MKNSEPRVGDVVVNDVSFTSAIGDNFREGTTFTVDLVGDTNARVRSPQGAVVWLAGHKSFFTGMGW